MKRCSWPGKDQTYIDYHDNEWGVPEYRSVALFEKLILDGFQAGLSWITKTETNFYGSNRIKIDIKNGCEYMIMGIKSEERIIPRKGNIILNSSKKKIGVVTSGTFSPTLQKPIGIGFILKENLNYGEEIFIDNKRKKSKAKISSLPFIKS